MDDTTPTPRTDTTPSEPAADAPAPAASRRPSPGRLAVVALAASALLGVGGLGYAAGAAGSDAAAGGTTSTSSTQQAPSTTFPGSPSDGSGSSGSAGGSTLPELPGGTFGRSSSGAGSTAATADQQEGVVLITSTTTSGEGAGTGMVLTSDGLVLTNHHVVEGATQVAVEVASTGETYEADVLGYDAEADVAVLRLEDASGLATVTTDTAEAVQAGDDVVGVGNAGGTGQATASPGTVTATGRTIDVGDESTGTTSTLSDLIEVDADIVAGDSGGPLYDDDGEVVGMDTAASTGSADVTGYAVPIATALDVVDQVLAGDESGGVSVGADAFLGVQLQDTGSGAVVVGTVDGSAAQDAGVSAGSTITALDGTEVTGADALSAAVGEHEPGDTVRLTWTDASGSSHQASVTLREGPVG
ncbi:trypsin-like peptidase domain-containing protein [Aeromicrobium sp. IC_218]|uniref:S1C family serine protease n=1 Tax=Aeromicrobium sp. IC_218 TaxID=2545468 RepID=UPI00103D6C15|nr:trypsin-like peptidase domain-containing protein [Aeromicrobium sp. IC_218]TCI97463.1 trypsin-like serine protease [Aeromicrobium sp. IC_218]